MGAGTSAMTPTGEDLRLGPSADAAAGTVRAGMRLGKLTASETRGSTAATGARKTSANTVTARVEETNGTTASATRAI